MAVAEVLPAHDGMAHPLFEPIECLKTSLIEPGIEIKNELMVDIHEVVPTAPASGVVTPLKETPGLYITGLGHQYPPFLFQPEHLESFIKKWYDLETPG